MENTQSLQQMVLGQLDDAKKPKQTKKWNYMQTLHPSQKLTQNVS